MQGRTGLSEAHLVILLVVRCFFVCICFSGLARGPLMFFAVHEEHLSDV